MASSSFSHSVHSCTKASASNVHTRGSGVGVIVGVDVMVGVNVIVGVGVSVGVTEIVGVGVGVSDGVGVGVYVGVGEAPGQIRSRSGFSSKSARWMRIRLY